MPKPMLSAFYHYTRARELLTEADTTRFNDLRNYWTARAQVHATLALVAAQVKP